MPRRNAPGFSPLLIVLMVALVIVVLWWLSRGSQPGPEPGPPPVSVHLTMGNPSNATTDPAQPDNYLMVKEYFALSYNNAKGTPNWVSWCLKQSDLGSAPRTEFHPDTTLPSTFKQVKPADYNGSGFDRGHVCPHGDRTATPEASEATFAMTNMIPQSPACNQKAWADFEDYCRELVRKKPQTLCVVAGPQGEGGQGSKGRATMIGHGEKMTVPANCWKVVLTMDNGTGEASDVGRVGANSRLIAVVMPNDMTVGHGWAKYRTSVKKVEKLTGYNFFSSVPAAIIDPLKEKVDQEHIPAARHTKSED